MCGIAGIWNLDGAPVSVETITRFTDSLAHRGPDGRGVWHDDTLAIALGHRRLSILDLSDDGAQPMSFGDGRWWIVFNGEIFNFVELRTELESHGHKFNSTSDTEVVLAAWVEWGEAMLDRFNGMWALAIYDREVRSLFIARDRFGIKPFLYLHTPRQFAFASELKSFNRLVGYTAEIDRETAAVFLKDGFSTEASSRTMLKGVSRLQPGCCGVLRDGKLSIRRWWSTADHLETPPTTLEDRSERFRELFYDAIALRMRSDVRIGSCLSGGFDSSAIVCALAEVGRKRPTLRQAEDWQATFVATFPGAVNDESEEAAEVVRYAGVDGTFFPITEDDALAHIDRILYDFDDVYVGMPTASWLIYRKLRENGIVVSLDGHGADELMGGYLQADSILFGNAPGFISSPLRNLQLLRHYNQVLERFSQFKGSHWFPSPGKALLAHHPSFHLLRLARRAICRVSGGGQGSSLLRNVCVSKEDFELTGERDPLPDSCGDYGRTFYRMFHSTLLPTILRNFDRMSMAHGVEIRMPFMDWRLVSYVFSLPDEAKIAAGENKRVARMAMLGRMPEKIRTGKFKIGLNSPMPEWFNGPLRKWGSDLVHDRHLKDHDLVDGDSLVSFFNQNTDARSWTWHNCGQLWPVLHYLWFERNFLNHE